jgi:FkbM family methyltransferase
VRITSYAQNFEDVLLWRALRHIDKGFYIDVGAFDPIYDSVSKCFYEQGWRGVHVEPTTAYATRIQADRPDEVVIQAAICETAGIIPFYEVPNTGLSTFSSEVAEVASEHGWISSPTLVPAISLDDLFSQIAAEDIHWLKIDVEGAEEAALRGWKTSSHRPWIIVIEAIAPHTREKSHEPWDHLVLAKGYKFAQFDGVNRYYVSDEKLELLKSFETGPCLWDEFQLPASNPIAAPLAERLTKQIDETAELLSQSKRHTFELSCAVERLEPIASRAQTLEGELARADQENLGIRQESQIKDARISLLERTADTLRLDLSELQNALSALQQEKERLAMAVRIASEGRWWRLGSKLSPAMRAASDLAIADGNGRKATNAPIPFYGSNPLKALTALPPQEFITQAYRLILGRDGDEQGVAHHLDLIRAGTTPIDILVGLRQSTEGHQFYARDPRLDGAFHRYNLLKAILPRFMLKRSYGLRDDPGNALSIAKLESFDDAAFVQELYRAILRRDPDPSGFSHNVIALRSGASKIELIYNLSRSDEAKDANYRIAGLNAALRRYRQRQSPWLRHWLQIKEAFGGRERDFRRLIAIENSLGILATTPTPTPSFSQTTSREVPPIYKANGRPFPRCDKDTTARTWDIPTADTVAHDHEFLASALVAKGQLLSASDADVRIVDNVDVEAVEADHTLKIGYQLSGDYGSIREIRDVLDGAAGVSRGEAKDLVDGGFDRPIEVVGRGMQQWASIVADRAYRMPGKGFRFLHVSACKPLEHCETLVNAFARIFGANDPVSLVIVPTSNAADRLYEWILSRSQHEDDFPTIIVVRTNPTDAQIKALYEQSDAFVSLSTANDFNVPVATALLTGIPAIVVAHGGHMTYCSADCCWLVDYQFATMPSDSDMRAVPLHADVENALSSVYHAPTVVCDKRVSRGKSTIADLCNWDQVADGIVRLAHRAGQHRADPHSNFRIGWVTTWNIRCGIATFTSHLSETIADSSVIFAAHDSLLTKRDGENVHRSWTVSKDENGLSHVSELMADMPMDAVIIQFNFGFFNHAELNDFGVAAVNSGKIVLFHLHSTVDPLGDVENYRLADLLPALSLCHRIIVHSPADRNRLKQLGLVDNVMIMPHGVVSVGDPTQLRDKVVGAPLLTSFGFAFYSKGLIELVEAIGILKRKGRRVRLRMLNAEYPTEESRTVLMTVRSLIRKLNLDDEIEVRSEFLDDDVCLALIGEADLVVNPYQRTGESASGATRYGLAAGRPVAVTPLPFFDDLGEAVYRFPGITPNDLAAGIDDVLRHLEQQTPHAHSVRANAGKWLDQHDFVKQGDRLLRMLRALAINTSYIS